MPPLFLLLYWPWKEAVLDQTGLESPKRSSSHILARGTPPRYLVVQGSTVAWPFLAALVAKSGSFASAHVQHTLRRALGTCREANGGKNLYTHLVDV